MKITTAMRKLKEMQAKDPRGEVSIKRLKPKKKKLNKRKLTETLKAWAQKKSADGGSFTFLEACFYYERIGGSAGTTTVWHRLCDIGARNVSPDLADKHLRAKWTCAPFKTAGPIKDVISQDPTFQERYQQARRELIERGALAPAPFDQVSFRPSHGKKGEFWVEVEETDAQRAIRLQVKPQPGHVVKPTDN